MTDLPADPAIIAAHFLDARRKAAPLAHFPGALPQDLDGAYAIQLAEIALRKERVAAWKVGRLNPALAELHGVDRFVGPIFSDTIQHYEGSENRPAAFPMFEGGLGAFEAEYIVRIARDADPARQDWTPAEARGMIDAVHIGIEIAGSPLATISELGALASIADFGNSNGLLIGSALPSGAPLEDELLPCTSWIDGRSAREATAAALPGGIMTALAFALNQTARMGHAVTGGQWISTGAVTGVHPVSLGQKCRADFGAFGTLDCVVAPVKRADD